MDDEDNKKAEPSEEKKDKQEAPSPDGENFESSLKKSFFELLGATPFEYLKSHLPDDNRTINQIFILIGKQTNVGTNTGLVGDQAQMGIENMHVSVQNSASDADKKVDAPQSQVKVPPLPKYTFPSLNPDKVNTYVEVNEPTSKPSQIPQFKNVDDVDEWFFSQSNVDNQIHLITVGVFAGNTYRFITETRERIKNLLENSTKSKKDEVSLSAFTKGDSSILGKTGTKVAESDFSVESGKTQLKTVTFADPKHQKYVLQFFSSSVDIAKIRSVVERLLAQICKLDGIDIHTLGTPLIDLTRAQSAIGLGELAKSDYEYYLNNIIRPWAKSPDPFLRFLVGWILFALATEETHKSKVESLLTHWAKSKNLFLEWTSAAACSRFGLMDLDKTLEIVKSLFETNYKYTLHATRVSLSLLYFSGQNASKIINALADWSESSDLDRDKKHFIQDNLAFAFLYLITDQIKDDIDDQENDNEKEADRKESMNIWLLLSKLPEREKDKLATSIAKLFNLSFKHQRAAIVDKACDILEDNMSAAETTWSKEILLVLQKIKAGGGSGSKYLQIILKRPSLRKNQHLFSGSL